MDEDMRRDATARVHGMGDRRAFMARIAGLVGGVAITRASFGAIAPNAAVSANIPPDDKRLKTSNIHWPLDNGRTMHGYMAIPAKAHGRQPAVMVVHDSRGLDDYTRDLARRIALAGFVTCAPDFLSAMGGTPADAASAGAMIGRLRLHQTVADAVATIRWLGTNRYATGKVGALGFFWGGALVDRIAIDAGPALTAAVSYYGPVPDPAEAIRVKAAMLLHFSGRDARTDADGRRWAAALQAAGVATQAYFYEGAHAGSADDTAAGHHDPDAAMLAWDRTLAFFEEYLR